MDATVRKIISLQPLRENLKLVAGESGLDNIITSVSVMEVPDFANGKLPDGLFVLTTLYGFIEDEFAMVDTIKKLAASHASGIIVKVNRYIDGIPASVAAAANTYGIPLFQIEQIHFSQIISVITGEIVNNEYNKIKTINDQYNEIFNALVSGEQIGSFLIKICNRLARSCACISEKGALLAHHCHNESDKNLMTEDYCMHIMRSVISIEEMHPDIESPIALEDCQVFLCSTKNRILGCFIVHSREKLEGYELLLAQQMTNYLSIKLIENQVVQADQRRRCALIMDEILLGKNNREETIRERLFLLGYEETKTYRILLFAVPEKKLGVRRTESIIDNVQSMLRGSVTYFTMDGLVVLCPTNENTELPVGDNKKLKNRIKDVIAKLNLECSVGCSVKQTDLCRIPEGLNQAKRALNYGRIFAQEENVYCYENFSEINSVSYMIGTSGEKEIYNSIIKPIFEHDSRYNQQLWLTLESCLLNATLEAAAKKLFIHSSTLRYRLLKIQNITGHDYFSNVGRYVLYTAYILYKIADLNDDRLIR